MLATLAELQKLHPELFVPLDCPRRAELKRRVKAVAARSKVKLSYTKFTESIRSMPRSVAAPSPAAENSSHVPRGR